MVNKKTPAKSLLADALDEAENQIEVEEQTSERTQSRIPVRKTGEKSKNKEKSCEKAKRPRSGEKTDTESSSSEDSDPEVDLGDDSFYLSSEFKCLNIADRASLRKVKVFMEARVVGLLKAVETSGGIKMKEVYASFSHKTKKFLYMIFKFCPNDDLGRSCGILHRTKRNEGDLQIQPRAKRDVRQFQETFKGPSVTDLNVEFTPRNWGCSCRLHEIPGHYTNLRSKG